MYYADPHVYYSDPHVYYADTHMYYADLKNPQKRAQRHFKNRTEVEQYRRKKQEFYTD